LADVQLRLAKLPAAQTIDRPAAFLATAFTDFVGASGMAANTSW
jgi:hypothetical protein